jgi:glyoxalase family protein
LSERITGIHHVTAIATDPRRNLEFYTEALGLRLVKQTVNFDDPGTYHLYFGDELGRPGTILTFFPWPLARRGERGAGQATTTALSVPEGSLGWWRRRLERFGAPVEEPRRRFEEEALRFLDPDGLQLELVAEAAEGESGAWLGGPIAAERAVRGVHSVALTVADATATAELLTAGLGLRAAGEAAGRLRFSAEGPSPVGKHVDLLPRPDVAPGRVAAGSVHHVAWRVAGDRQQEEWRQRLGSRGLGVTPVQERNYFRSIYFREPGGVLFEIATDGPGFATDERPSELGTELKLPRWLEPQRDRIAAALPELAPVAASLGAG